MTRKNTIAIIGATGDTGRWIAKAVLVNPCRLLLMDDTINELEILQQELKELKKDVETDILHCSKDASWEADVIIIAVAAEELAIVAEKIRDVAVCKTIICITASENDKSEELQVLLPHSKVASVFLEQDFKQQFINTDENFAIIEGMHEEAIQTSSALLQPLGFYTIINNRKTRYKPFFTTIK
jgi:predicted dinucleotide-binding enzyme